MNLGKILSSFAKHYKPGHGGFALNKPVNSNGVTEQSYAGVQVPMQNQAGSQFIKNADPQTMYRTRMNAVEGNPLNFIGDMGTKLGGGENGRVEIMAEKLPLGTEKDLTRRPFETMGIDQIKEYPAQGQEFDGAYPTEMEGNPLNFVSDSSTSRLGEKLSKTKGEINRREGKDFRKGGADYDKDHDFKDVLRSFGLGALQSLAQADPSRESLGMMLGRGLGGGISGGIGGALDRNADEKMGNKIALGNLYQDYAKQLGVQDAELGISKKQKDLEAQDSIIRDRETDNQRQQSELERKIAKDEATNKYWTAKIDQGKIRLAQNEELIAIRDRLAQSKDKNDQRRLDLVEKEMENRNMRAESDRLSRETIARMTEAGRNARANIAEHGRAERAKAALEGMDTRQRKAAIDKAVDRWKQQNPGYSADDVKNVRDNLIKIYGQ